MELPHSPHTTQFSHTPTCLRGEFLGREWGGGSGGGGGGSTGQVLEGRRADGSPKRPPDMAAHIAPSPPDRHRYLPGPFAPPKDLSKSLGMPTDRFKSQLSPDNSRFHSLIHFP